MMRIYQHQILVEHTVMQRDYTRRPYVYTSRKLMPVIINLSAIDS